MLGATCNGGPQNQISNFQRHATTFYTFFDQPLSILAILYIFMQFCQLNGRQAKSGVNLESFLIRFY